MSVFISYAQSEESDRVVRELAKELRRKNILVQVDIDVQAPTGPVGGWSHWMQQQIKEAQWVLLLFDQNYYHAWNRNTPNGRFRGSVYEAWLVFADLYDKHLENNKYLPLIPDTSSEDLIPPELLDTSSYRVPSETQTLCQRLLNDPRTPLAPQGQRVDIERLHGVAPPELIDREDIKKLLDQTLAENKTGVIGLIADGGIGKTAAVLDWLTNLDIDELGLDRVFAWSFFDAVHRQPTTSTQFFDDAFKRFPRPVGQVDVNLPHGDADVLAGVLRSNRSVLVLDGLDSAQDPRPDYRGRFTNAQGIDWLLRNIAEARKGHAGRLVVVTSRLPLTDLEKLAGYKEVLLEQLTSEDGADLLTSLGVKGSRDELIEAATQYEGHCLSLVLLGSIINRKYPDHHISNRKLLPPIPADSSVGDSAERFYEHARRVMDFYEEQVSRTEDVALLQMMGLFLEPLDRPQRDYIVDHARFAEPLRALPSEWTELETRLEGYRLLIRLRKTVARRMKWDCHPLIRAYFRERLRENEVLWRDAHSVLFEYFEQLAQYRPDTREGLRPLYRAVRHGCIAHRYTEALRIYRKRILRDEAQGYSTNRLGAAADDIACLYGFLMRDGSVQEAVRQALPDQDIAWLWARMAFCQTCRGALDDAVRNRRDQLKFAESKADLMGQSSARENLSALHLLEGKIVEAKEEAERAIQCAKVAKDWGQIMRGSCRLAAACYFHGDLEGARKAFTSAEKMQRDCGGPEPWIVMDHGFYYRWWRLDNAASRDDYEKILHDAEGAEQTDQSWLATLGTDRLAKAIALLRMGEQTAAENVFKEALDTLEESGFVLHMPYYHCAKVELELNRGKPAAALEHARQAKELARYYGLPLLLADAALVEAEAVIASKKPDDAHHSLNQARKLIEDHGYVLRTLELHILDSFITVKALDIGGQELHSRKYQDVKALRDDIVASGRLGLLDRYRAYLNLSHLDL